MWDTFNNAQQQIVSQTLNKKIRVIKQVYSGTIKVALRRIKIALISSPIFLNPIQSGLFWPSKDCVCVCGGGGGGGANAPLHFLKTIEDMDMKRTPLIKRCKINLLLQSYLDKDSKMS